MGISYRDPIDYVPYNEPLNPPQPTSYEVAFPEAQRQWIRNRDNNQCQMPVIDENGLFVSYVGDKTPLQVHHITPESHYKHFEPEKYENKFYHNPLNGITIGSYSHTHIHRDWIHAYKSEYEMIPPRGKLGLSFEGHVALQTAQGRPSWLTRYDKYFHLIATLNTHDHIVESGEFPFKEEYRPIINSWYDKAIKTYPEFVESYYFNRGW